MMGSPAVGTVTGTGAALNVELGFSPKYVKVVNVTDPTVFEWFEGMADASAIKTTDAVAMTAISTNGITPYAGSTTASKGFTIGADADLNASGETLHYIAYADNE